MNRFSWEGGREPIVTPLHALPCWTNGTIVARAMISKAKIARCVAIDWQERTHLPVAGQRGDATSR